MGHSSGSGAITATPKVQLYSLNIKVQQKLRNSGKALSTLGSGNAKCERAFWSGHIERRATTDVAIVTIRLQAQGQIAIAPLFLLQK